MKTALETTPLGEVASFIRGITFKPTDVMPVGTPGSVLCMRTKNVQARLDLSDVWAVSSTLVKRPDQFMEAEDILVSSANSWNLVGKCCWIPSLDSPSSFGGFVSVLRANPSKVEPRYLYHWFSSPRIQATVRSFGQQTTNISNLNIDRCLRLGFPLPSLEEQRRIAEVLDRADELRAKRRQALAHLDELVQSIFLEMFGNPDRNCERWPRKAIRELLESATYGSSEKASLAGDLPILRMNNITRDGHIDLTDLKYLNAASTTNRHQVSAGDILFNRTNSPDLVGKTAIYRGSEPMAYAGYLIRLRVNANNNPEYLAAFMNTRYAKRVLRGMCKSIIGMANINAKELQTIPIAQPPLELQNAFASRLREVERVKATNRESLTELDALFASLQDRAFRGLL